MAKKTGKKKISIADQIEAQIRAGYLPSQLATALGDILAIEMNAKWRETPEGKKDAEEVDKYTPEELAAVLEKQAARRVKLLEKVAFIKKLINGKGL